MNNVKIPICQLRLHRPSPVVDLFLGYDFFVWFNVFNSVWNDVFDGQLIRLYNFKVLT